MSGENFSVIFTEKSHLPHISAIEELKEQNGWNQEDCARFMSKNGANGLTAIKKLKTKSLVAGYCFYRISLKYERIRIYNINVVKKFRRKGVGTKLIDMLKTKLTDKVKTIEVIVSEHDINLSLFFSSMGFKSVLVRDYFDTHDGYKFTFEFEKE